jgi:hypothetical protein
LFFVDSEVKRKFRNALSEYLANKSEASENYIREQLSKWQQNHEKLKPLSRNSKSIADIIEHSINLSALASAGLEALICEKLQMDQLKNGSGLKQH